MTTCDFSFGFSLVTGKCFQLIDYMKFRYGDELRIAHVPWMVANRTPTCADVAFFVRRSQSASPLWFPERSENTNDNNNNSSNDTNQIRNFTVLARRLPDSYRFHVEPFRPVGDAGELVDNVLSDELLMYYTSRFVMFAKHNVDVRKQLCSLMMICRDLCIVLDD